MKKILIIILFFNLKTVNAEEFRLICHEDSKSFDKSFAENFSKIINFKNQTINNYSGGYFDELVLFGRNEIVLKNNIFSTMSTYNIETNKWTIYRGQTIKLYECEKEKRRF